MLAEFLHSGRMGVWGLGSQTLGVGVVAIELFGPLTQSCERGNWTLLGPQIVSEPMRGAFERSGTTSRRAKPGSGSADRLGFPIVPQLFTLRREQGRLCSWSVSEDRSGQRRS